MIRPAHSRASRVPGLSFLFVLCLTLSSRGGTLEWESGDGFRRARLEVSAQGRTGFQQLEASTLGIQFTNRISKTQAILNRNLLNGSGVAVGDIDGDGWPDLYFCRIEGENALYRCLGDWKFKDITRLAGVGCSNLVSTGAVFADVNGDGRLDLLVTGLGEGVHLFLNQGNGRFLDATGQAGLTSKAASMSMALADVNEDGALDLYVANYRVDTIADMPTTTFQVQTGQGRPVVAKVNGEPVTLPKWTNRFEIGPSGDVLELGEPDFLYLNDGAGKFTLVSFTDGAFLDENGRPLSEPPRDWGLSVQMCDFNGDGAPDIYVCNDFFTPDRIWINGGKGKFRAAARTALRSTSVFSMGVDMADIDRDGNLDIFVTDMLSPDHRKRHVQLEGRSAFHRPIGSVEDRPQISRNTLQRSRGDGSFEEIAYYAGVEASDWSWGPVVLDVDLDGYEDILVSNGVLRDFQNIDMANRFASRMTGRKLTRNDVLQFMDSFPSLETSNVLYRNKGDWTFEEVGWAWGFSSSQVSQGMALADFDNDGDLDVVINNLGQSPGIYRNESIAPRLAIRLKGGDRNVQGVGSKIIVRGGPVDQTAEMICGGHYLSCSQAMRVFAAGTLTNSLTVEVLWPDGQRSVCTAEPDFIYEIDARGGKRSLFSTRPEPKPFFEEVQGLGAIVHVEQPFDELARQPSLLKYLSQLGPGVCWHDCNGDGWEDLVVGSGRGGRLTVLENKRGSGFTLLTNALVNRTVGRDQTAVLGTAQTVLVGSSNYEDGSAKGGLIRIYDFQRHTSGDSLVGYPFSCGPLALTDIDGDGDLDLFVGGRVLPGRYPEPADSLLFRNDGGKLVVMQRWEKLGLVGGAVFSDLDQDGYPELVLAMEWGPIRIFKITNGEFEERTEEWGLAGYTGWWNGVATGDFYGDGRLEIVASNWGLNSAYRTSPTDPRKLYFGDLDGNGTVDLVEARFDSTMGKEVPERTFNIVRAAIPYLQDRVPTYDAYANMSVQEIYGQNLSRAAVLEAKNFESVVFSFHNGKFAVTPLPPEAQLAPAFAVCIGDFDGDGCEDIFLSQNFFALAPSEPRCDAGRGLWLRGNGQGQLTPVPGQESGVRIYGDQRGAALGDYDADGRVDLAVAQNGSAIRVFRNKGARPGLRVRLAGPAGNPNGIGASIRLESSGIKGFLREVQAGSGYWSQNGAVQVMALPGAQQPTKVWVRWPGGKVVTAPIPSGAREIEVKVNGAIKQLQ